MCFGPDSVEQRCFGIRDGTEWSPDVEVRHDLGAIMRAFLDASLAVGSIMRCMGANVLVCYSMCAQEPQTAGSGSISVWGDIRSDGVVMEGLPEDEV